MKNLFAVVFLVTLVTAVPMAAQEPIAQAPAEAKGPTYKIDAQFWSMSTSNETRVYPWILLYGPKGLVVDVRHGFDVKGVFGGYVGKQFGDKIYFIPQVGVLFGPNFKGFGPELYVGGEVSRVSFFTQWQWAQSLREQDAHWFYHYGEALAKIAGPISFGAAGQAFWEKSDGSKLAYDLGPQIKADIKGISLRFWPAWRVTSTDRGAIVVFCAISKTFSFGKGKK